MRLLQSLLILKSFAYTDSNAAELHPRRLLTSALNKTLTSTVNKALINAFKELT